MSDNSQDTTNGSLRRSSDLQRYTVDLEKQHRKALAMWAVEWEVDKSNIVRGLLLLLEADADIRSKLQAILFDSDEKTE
jgi:hypothetical protein